MGELDQLLVFSLDDQRYALHLCSVDRVVRAVEVTPLPDAPEIVLGIINLQGRIIPAINMRKRFLLPEKELFPSDQFIISSSPRRTYALVVDAALFVVKCPGGSIVHATEILPRMGPVEGVLILADGMVLISDLDRFLSLGEEAVDADPSADLSPCAATGEDVPEIENEP